MSNTVGLASIGLGWWGGTLARSVASSGEGRVVSCFSRTKETREQFASEHGCRAAGSLDELLSDDEVAGVIIATSHDSHRSLVEAAAAAGKHVFVDKPLTTTVEDGRACVEAAERGGVALQVGHQRRRTAANREIKRRLEAGDLGDVEAIETSQSLPNGFKMPPSAWRWDPDQSPLGGMTSLGVHKIDTMHYLAGPIVSVAAMTRPGREHPIDEMTVLAVEFAGGALGTLITSFFTPLISRVSVFGTGGAAYNEADGKMLFVQGRDEPGRTEVELAAVDPIVDQMREFVAVVRGEATPETDGRAGLAVVAVMEAAVKSAATGVVENVTQP